MMSVSPFNVSGSSLNTWDKDSRWWSTPYSADNSYLTGFSHVNLSGVGCPELGSVLVMPTVGVLEVDSHRYGSTYNSEQASPGYYSVRLDNGDVLCEVTATPRSSAERYTFHKGRGNILVNLGLGLTNESGSWVRRISDTEIEGMRMCGTFCYNPQAVFQQYFYIKVSKAPVETGLYKRQPQMTAEVAWDRYAGRYKSYDATVREIAGDDLGAWWSFDFDEGESVLVQVGVSFVSPQGARLNLETEQGAEDFDTLRAAAQQRWESDLGRIKVTGGSLKDRQVFYTALYHALLHPNVLNDVNGEYPMMQGGPLAASAGIDVVRPGIARVPEGQQRYTVFSLWDTCRNLHQLLTLVYPERQLDMVRSMVDMYKEWGWMPKWELYGRETFTMEGDPAIPMITDTYLKGLTDFDIEAAYEAFVKSAETPGAANPMRPDGDPYREMGYIPLGIYAADFSGDNSVSHALEYYMADAALARLAEKLAAETHDPERSRALLSDARRYRERSLGYRHYYSQDTGTLRPKMEDGSFLEPFNPRQGENFEPVPGFHEGSAWNYTFYVPHDIEGLCKLMGGRRTFAARLQKVFDEGLYDPANEPDIAYPYIFSRLRGYEHLTAKTVSKLLDQYYTTDPDGIPGNDDTGTMSAWAVWAMMGLYPDCPGEPMYTVSVPVFDSIEINGRYVIRRDRKIRNHRITHDQFIKNYEK